MRILRFIIASAVVSAVGAAAWITTSSPLKSGPVPAAVAPRQAAASTGQPVAVALPASQSLATEASSGQPVVIKPTVARSASRRAQMREALESMVPQPGRRTPGASAQNEFGGARFAGQSNEQVAPVRQPREDQMRHGGSFDGDLRTLPQRRPVSRERPEREAPAPRPRMLVPPGAPPPPGNQGQSVAIPAINAPAPGTLIDFDGLDREFWGSGSPPDTNGDAGPVYYIQTVNTAMGIYRKSDGFREAAFTFDTFMSQGNFGNLCDTDNFGDPVVLYDSFEDRWIISDFAFALDGGGDVVAPAYQCVAASKTGDPLAGGWNFYSLQFNTGLNDYPKFGIWPDGLYMSANMFGFGAGGAFQNVKVVAFNKAQMYAGAPSVQVVSFDVGGGDFTLLPSNARLQAGTPPPGRPNLFISTWQFLNALTVYKFHVDWNSISLSTLTGPDAPVTATSWPNASVADAAQPGTATLLDVLQIRAMAQNQYSHIGGEESVWATHTVRRGNTTGLAAPRWYQVNVTGGTVASPTLQAATWDPDGANVINRFMPSLAIDRVGNMAMGYSVSSGGVFPSIRYAGRLATDPVNTFSQTEQTLFTGAFSQTGSTRWGDYSAMTLDTDGCTFWYTNEYANSDQTSNKRWRTRIGAFKFAACVPVANGALQGTVTSGGNPQSGATVSLGSRTAITDVNGFYAFASLPAGTYPIETASAPGFVTGTVTSIVVVDGNTTVQNFSLAAAATSACFVDTTQADFQAGIATACDLTTSPGNVTLSNTTMIDQQNTTVTTSGFGFNSTAWAGQTFTPAITGEVTRIDLDLFCSECTGTTPAITVSIRETAGSPALPTGADLATATIPGFSSGSGGYFAANFASPVELTAGTTYAVILRAASNPTAGTYAYVCSCSSPNSNPYANGRRVTSATSGSSWAADVISGGRDLGFKVFVHVGFPPSGTFVSSLKDANPAIGSTTTWGNINWNASVPGGTTLMFQVAGSNNVHGPFTFVGPDGTPATFFSNGGSLAQFNGMRYLRYQAQMTSTGAATPTIADVTLCFTSTAPGAFNKLNPPDTATGQPLAIVLSWSASLGATSYQYCIDTNNNNACDTSWISTGTATNVQLAPLPASTAHYWHVRAINGGGTTYSEGDLNAFWTFTTGAASGPFGQVDTPIQDALGVQGAIGVTGWGLDDVNLTKVEIFRNCLGGSDAPNCQTVLATSVVYIGDAAFLTGARPDVAAAFPTYPNNSRAGWGYLMLTPMLPHVTGGQPFGGQGPLTIYAIATDSNGNKKILGRTFSLADNTPTSITMANDTIAKPFGAIDTPGQGETIGGTFNNFGWAITPDSNTIGGEGGDILIPINGSTMTVFIDGNPVSLVAYNQCRGNVGNPPGAGVFCNDDVANIFGNPTPQPVLTTRTSNPTKFRNLDAERGAIGAYTFDTTLLSNGLHTIAWSVSDSLARNEGIGSRFFIVSNPEDVPLGPTTAFASAQPQVLGAVSKLDHHTRVTQSVWGRTGFDLATPWTTMHAKDDGTFTIRLAELGRLELWLGDKVDAGYMVANDTLQPLPVGSSLNASRFAWMPPAGYIGPYHLAFVRGGERIDVTVTVVEKPRVADGEAQIRMQLDAVTRGPASVGHLGERTVRVEGWAFDPQAAIGSGIAAVHVWATPEGSDGAPFFLGAASLEQPRPDVRRTFADAPGHAGFSLTASLKPGTYTLTAYAWNERTERWEDARHVTVVVR